MFVDRLLNQGNAPLLTQWLKFTAARHRLIAENVVNLSTPGYQQRDLSLDKFQAMLRERVDERSAMGTLGATRVRFEDVQAEVENPERGMLFHDGANRSAEQLMTDQAKNALMHNLAVELLRKQFSSLEAALKERVA
jgi:flagellar basal-body rod protein FlgB